MNEVEKHKIISELRDLYKSLKSYNRYLRSQELSETQKQYAERLREELVRKSGALKVTIFKLTGKIRYTQFGQVHDIWDTALSAIVHAPDRLTALGRCMDATNETIGRLESTPLTELDLKEVKIAEPPKAFIAHGGRSGILDKLREFIEALGIKPVIVELAPTRGMTVDEKVNKYIKDSDCGIVLATKGGIVDTKAKKARQHPRLNVIDELERLRAAFPAKTILLVERGADLPSNISGLTYEPFVGQSMDRAFTAIARELTEFGILKAVKP